MTLALIAAFVAAVCYGLGSLLQAVGARRPAKSVLAVTQSLPYLAGIGLDLMAFAVSTVALRRLPLFSVQAIVASSVVVTALLASLVLGLRLRRVERVAVAAACLGLLMLGLSSSGAPPESSPPWLAAIVLIVAIGVAAAGAFTLRRSASGPLLGLLAGAAFGLVSLSVRLLRIGPDLASWLADPAAYALLLSGAVALFLYAAALQRTHVTRTTAVVVTVDALLPAAVGVLLLGDRAAAGRGWLALLGFGAAVCGAVVLSRAGIARRGAGRHLRPTRLGSRSPSPFPTPSPRPGGARGGRLAASSARARHRRTPPGRGASAAPPGSA